MIFVGDLVWYDDEILALVLDLDHMVHKQRRVLIQDTDGLQMAVHLSDLCLA
jgi:hypothetical protein